METNTLLPTDIIGIRAAGAILGVAASTISRQVKAGIIPNRGTCKEPKVSIVEATAARKGNIDPAQQRAPEGADLAANNSYHANRADREWVRAQKEKLEYAQILGTVMLRADAEDKFSTFGRHIREALAIRWRTLATELQGLSAIEIERAGTKADEDLLTRIVAEIEKEYAVSGQSSS